MVVSPPASLVGGIHKSQTTAYGKGPASAGTAVSMNLPAIYGSLDLQVAFPLPTGSQLAASNSASAANQSLSATLVSLSISARRTFRAATLPLLPFA